MKWTRWGIENNILEEVCFLWNSTLYSKAIFFRIASCCFFVHLDSPRKNSYVPCGEEAAAFSISISKCVHRCQWVNGNLVVARDYSRVARGVVHLLFFHGILFLYSSLWLSSAGWGFGFGWYNPPKTQHRDSWFSPFWHSFREWVFVQKLPKIKKNNVNKIFFLVLM